MFGVSKENILWRIYGSSMSISAERTLCSDKRSNILKLKHFCETMFFCEHCNRWLLRKSAYSQKIKHKNDHNFSIILIVLPLPQHFLKNRQKRFEESLLLTNTRTEKDVCNLCRQPLYRIYLFSHWNNW